MSDIILPKRIDKKSVISGEINYLIRIGNKNKWTRNSIHNLKSTHNDPDPIKITIIKSEQIYVTNLSLNILKHCGYSTIDSFKEQWENWYQTYDDFAKAWLINFELLRPESNNSVLDIFS